MTDNAKFQYDEFVKEEVPQNRDKFLEFDMRKEHKSCKLAYQRKKLGEENKKAGKYKNEKDLKRKLKIDKIQEVNKMQN